MQIRTRATIALMAEQAGIGDQLALGSETLLVRSPRKAICFAHFFVVDHAPGPL